MTCSFLRNSALTSAFVLLTAAGAWAQDIPASKQTKAGLYVTAAQAVDMLDDQKVLFVDVRTRSEITFVGIADRVDVHIPLRVMPEFATYNPDKGAYDLVENPDFIASFKQIAAERNLDPETPVMLICRSGSRSARAADMLYDAGFTQVYSVIDGFEGDKAKDGPDRGHRVLNGWKNAGLSWSYKIRADQAYPMDRM